jgi:hypothetical protein
MVLIGNGSFAETDKTPVVSDIHLGRPLVVSFAPRKPAICRWKSIKLGRPIRVGHARLATGTKSAPGAEYAPGADFRAVVFKSVRLTDLPNVQGLYIWRQPGQNPNRWEFQAETKSASLADRCRNQIGNAFRFAAEAFDWRCVRCVAAQAAFPLIGLSEFARPPLQPIATWITPCSSRRV